MISSLVTWYGYMNGCITSFNDREILMDGQAVPIPDGDINGDNSTAAYIVDFDWQAGRGYLFVVVATLLKIVDVVCNLAVPTPTICRDHGEQAIYEVIALNRDVLRGEADEEEVMKSVRRLNKSFRVMKEQSIGRLEGGMSQAGGGNSASAWPRLVTMDTLNEAVEEEEEEEEEEEDANSTEATALDKATIRRENNDEDQLHALERRLADELGAMDSTPSPYSTRRGNVATSVYF